MSLRGNSNLVLVFAHYCKFPTQFSQGINPDLLTLGPELADELVQIGRMIQNSDHNSVVRRKSRALLNSS